MRRAVLLLACMLLMLSFGCIEEIEQEAKKEQVQGVTSFDVDNDGQDDYEIYDFVASSNQDTGKTTKRQISVIIETSGSYSSYTNLTNDNLVTIDNYLREAINDKKQSDSACSQNLGVETLPCIDVYACSQLCSAQNTRCRKLVEKYDKVIGGSVVEFVEKRDKIENDMYSVRNQVPDLKDASVQEKDRYLEDIRTTVANIARINSNPVYTRSEILLCSKEDFGAERLRQAAEAVGDYKLSEERYTYIVTVSVKDLGEPGFGKELENIVLEDEIRSGVLDSVDDISSHQELTVSGTSSVVLKWSEKRATDEGYLFVYEFSSELPPSEVINWYKTPTLKVKNVDASAVEPVNLLFLTLFSNTDNYYISLGIVIGVVLIVVNLVYTLVIILIGILRAKISGQTLITGIKKSLGRTDIRWKLDGLIAVILLIVGVYGANSTIQPNGIKSLLDMGAIDFMLTQWWGVTAVAGMAFGIHLCYTASENFIKILMLEKAHGTAIREEKEQFKEKVKRLKQRAEELKTIVDKVAAEDFDVGKEYDILSRLTAEKITKLGEKETMRTRRQVDEKLNEVENAIEGLTEKQRIADQNWAKWNEMMNSILEEKKEIYLTSLVTIPASLRQWALRKYVKENAGKGIVLEKDIVKQTVIAPENMVNSLISMKLIDGVVVLKRNKIFLSKMSEGSGTVPGILTVKLRQYVAAFSKNLGQHDPVSFAAIGSNNVLVLMKGKKIESLLFVRRDKFKEAIETWKAKSVMFDN